MGSGEVWGGVRGGGRVYRTSPHTPTHFPTSFQTFTTPPLTCPHIPSKPKKLEFSNFQVSSVTIPCSMFGLLESLNGKPLIVACNCHLVGTWNRGL